MTLPNCGKVSMASIMFCCQFFMSYHDHDLICADVNRGFRISGNTYDVLLHVPSVFGLFIGLFQVVRW